MAILPRYLLESNQECNFAGRHGRLSRVCGLPPLLQKQERHKKWNARPHTVKEVLRFSGLRGSAPGLLRLEFHECADLHRIVKRNRDRMKRRLFMEEPRVASLLPNHGIAKAFEDANQPVSRYPTRQFHAASTAISSSLTKCSWMSLGAAAASSKWRLAASCTFRRNSSQVSASVKIA